MDDADAGSTPPHGQVVEAYFDALLRPDARARLAEICHPAVVFHDVVGDFTGLAGFDSELLTRPRALIPALRVELLEVIGDPTECAARWQLRGSLPAPAGGAAAGSTPLLTEGTTWFRFDGELVAEVWTYWDGAALFEAFENVEGGV